MLFGCYLASLSVKVGSLLMLAFIHTDQEEEKHAQFPPCGYAAANPGKCLKLKKLKKSLCGQQTAPQMSHKWPKRGLEARGWRPSELNPFLCLHETKDVMFIVHCDDGTFCAKNQKDVNNAMQELSNPMQELSNPIVDTDGNELQHGHVFSINKD